MGYISLIVDAKNYFQKQIGHSFMNEYFNYGKNISYLLF